MSVATSDVYLQNLNDAQRSAVVFDYRKALQIIAGPGTGKTKVLTARFAYLVLKMKMNAEDIVMTTFTRKAAEEMKERLVPVLVANGVSPHGLKIGTFHSICWKLLKEKGFLIGKDKIERATTERIKSITEALIVEMPDQIRDYACTKSYKNEVSLCRLKNNQWQVHPDMILKRISELKADAITPEKYEQQAIFDEALLHLYQQYQAKLSKENLIDFDDVMLYSFELLSKHRVWKNIRHVLIDEFQDTNLLQIHLIFQFARGSHHSCEGVTVVGDPDQGIYGFRSALSHNFQTMIELCPIEYDQIVLKENYRSAQAILDISETVIKQQKSGRDNREPLRAQFVTDNKPVFMSFPSDDIEAYTIAKEILYLKSVPGLFEYKDFSILVRLKRSLRTFENALIAHKIPYVIQKGYTFWELRECKAIIRYMSMLCNDDDWSSLKRTINYPNRGVGDTTVAKIAAAFEKQLTIDKNETAFGFLQKVAHGSANLNISKHSLVGIKEYVDVIEQMRQLFSEVWSDASKDTIADAFEKLYILSGLKGQYKPSKNTGSSSTDDPNKGQEAHRHINIVNVKNYFSTFKIPLGDDDKIPKNVDLVDFCREFVSFTDLYTFKEDNDDDAKDEHLTKDAVVLSTIHASKGLEWPVVFVPQCIEGLLPSYYKDSNDLPLSSQDSNDELSGEDARNEAHNSQDESCEGKRMSSPSKKKSRTSFSEERRMFFVALTRAKYLLYITTVENETTPVSRSRFLKNEVIELCDDKLRCFESVEQLFKLYYTMKVQIPNQDRISYDQLIKDYYKYGLNNRQMLFWKDTKHSHVDLPNITENKLGIITQNNEAETVISSALPRVNISRFSRETIHLKPGELIVKQEKRAAEVFSAPPTLTVTPNLSPTKQPSLTREETRELDVFLSDNEFLSQAPPIKSETEYTAAEILHNKDELLVDNRPILTSARILASAIKKELSQTVSDITIPSQEVPHIKTEEPGFKGKVPKKPRKKPAKKKDNLQQKNEDELKSQSCTNSVKKPSRKQSRKVKIEPKFANDILLKLEKAKQRKEEWDGEIIDLRSSQ
ncbi:unnamed protein product [Kluyveromyces dobzhanskii CBS 2104]|uniref:DNA 3'-5' helicase n=1 Tax=Kluyveromyces dobzhanskii CBS 2104 TaxID=1427455 RepID=A0A0A8LCT2_9SACH|nr:unnamed protein product [Kluyveromyces dobzhanskii CBS 2104]